MKAGEMAQDLRASYGAGRSLCAKTPSLNAAESLLGIVVRRRKPIQVENVQTSSRYQNAEVARREGIVALLSMPLIFAGEAIGCPQCLYRPALSILRRGSPHSLRARGIVRPRH